MSQRIKGQETSVVFTGPNGVEDTFKAIISFDATQMQEILSEGYLGETSNRRDDIFNGYSGELEMHLESSVYVAFAERVKDRAQRRSPASGQFNVTGVYNFPNGQRIRWIFIDVFFGDLPLSTGGRGEYVSAKVSFECQDGKRIAS